MEIIAGLCEANNKEILNTIKQSYVKFPIFKDTRSSFSTMLCNIIYSNKIKGLT